VTALSEDGATLFGIGSESMQGGQAFRWTQSGGFEDLARLPGATFTHVAAVASEGTAVGTQYSPGFSPSRTHAVLWTPSGEALSLQTLLAASGVNVEDVYLMFAFDLSNDAGAVTGVSFSPSLGMRVFIADLRSPCIADFNQDGGVDGSDVTAFFEAWESGSIQADANADGGIDGADVSAFFALWENGGCS
jgi:hypothetical protein